MDKNKEQGNLLLRQESKLAVKLKTAAHWCTWHTHSEPSPQDSSHFPSLPSIKMLPLHLPLNTA